VIKVWERIFQNRNIFQAYEGGQERFKMLDDARDEKMISGFIGRQENFKKKGHKVWRYNNAADTNNNTVQVVQQFTPISTLINSMTAVAYKNNGDSKMEPKFSILISPYVDYYSK
jgi:hypothetical protein